jgi:hypothetical protein
MIEKIKKYGKIIITGLITLATIIIGIAISVFLFNKKVVKQTNKNDEDINKIKEEKKDDKKTYDNIVTDFNNSPFERARKGNK